MRFDCFTFFDELMLLEVRLKELDPVIDKFVLVEATHTFSGIPKPLTYDEVKDNEVFAPYKDKIIDVVYDIPPQSKRRDEERLQRNYISMGLKDAQPDDIIIVTDLDEIIDHRTVALMEDYQIPVHLRMKFFYYFFNCRASQDWWYPAFCRYRDYCTADSLRLGKPDAIIANAGWHFSYLVPPEDIPKKLEAFAHSEFDTLYHRNVERLKKCVENNEDIFERPDMRFSIEPLDAPQCVMENEDKYTQYIKRQADVACHAG